MSRKQKSGGEAIREYGIFGVLVLTFVTAAVLEPNFLKIQNLTNILKQIIPFGIVACAETILIVSGSIDLAAGTTLALAACVGAKVLVVTNSVLLAFLGAIAIGMLVNLISGLLVTRFKLPPFIATLAMMNVAQGAANLFTDGKTITNLDQLRWLGQGRVFYIPIMAILFAAVLLLVYIIMKKTKFGLQMYAIGGNTKATVAAGINAGRQLLITFLLAGALTGIAAMVTASRMLAAQPTVGSGYEFDAITATVVGGTAFSGGVGGVRAIVIGSLIIGIINNVLVLAGVNSSWQIIVKGLLIALAVMLDLNTKKNGKTKG